MVTYHPVKFDGHKNCGGKDILFKLLRDLTRPSVSLTM